MNGFSFKDSESRALTLALFSAVVMIAHQVAGKATRDALFLSHFDVTNLPKVVIAAAIISLIGVLVISRLLARHGPSKLIPLTFTVSAGLFIGEWVLFGIRPDIAAVVLYLHMAVFGAVLISGFWSVINERFDPHSAKRRIARIAAAATLGGIVGGIVAERVTALVDVRAMLLVLSFLHLICAISVFGVGSAGRSSQTQAPPEVRSGFSTLRRNPYLRWMGLLMLLVALVAAFLDYAFKAEASARYTSSESLVAFFASFYAIVGVITFALQTLLGPRLLQRFGLGATIAVLPTVVFFFGFLGTAITQLWTMVMLRGSHAVLLNSFHRTSFELLYTPLPPHKKRPTKTIIDVASDRLGDLLGGGCILLLLWLMPEVPTAVIVALAVVAAGASLYVVRVLYRGYVGQLAHSLQKGVVQLSADEVVDATTQHILAETSALSEREMLTAKLKAMDRSGAVSADKAEELEQAAGTQVERSKSERFAQAVANLTSGDSESIRCALNSDFMDIRLTPYLIPLLANESLAQDARTELRWLVPRIIGQLTDALLEPELPLLVRQRIPGILEASHNPRAIDALLQGLVDEEFNVRYSCARALARMQSRNSALIIAKETVFAAVHREVDVKHEEWDGRRLTSVEGAGEEDAPATDSEAPVHRSLEHVFNVLGLILDRDALKLALRAVLSSDANLRGTALEYLENVLPEDLRRDLWRHLDIGHHAPGAKRSAADVLNELKTFLGSRSS